MRRPEATTQPHGNCIIRGAFAAAAVGAGVGLVLWAALWHVGSYFFDAALAGGVFGLAIGGAGAATRAAARRAAPAGVASALGVAAGGALGVAFGLSSGRGAVEPIMYGAFGTIGAAVAIVAAGRRASVTAGFPPAE